jgi:cyclophilin family peptidyl-prolyl cis-trans isomerase/protein-disulfide isomerase
MRKLWFSLVITAAMLLSACSQVLSPANPMAKATATAAKPQPALSPIATQDPNAKTMECQLVSMSPTQGPTETSMFPPPSETDWSLGNNANASLTIIEYSDFQCPYCAQLAPVLEQLQKNHPDDIRVIFRYFPLPSHPLSIPSAEAAEAAGMQGKFWEMHNALFSNQGTWASMTSDQFNVWLDQQAQTLGLDKGKFEQDRKSKPVIDKVQAAQKHGIDIGIPGTPAVLLNGQFYQGPRDLTSLESILGLFQIKSRQFTYCPPMQIDTTRQYTATLKTDKGDVVIQLYPDKAPMAVNSFVFLAKQGWFNNVTFHRVIPGFVAQTGDPSGTGLGGPGYSFGDELKGLKFDKEGLLGMANAGPGSNGSQFFITYAAQPNLDGKYTIFGQVIQGMEVVKKLTPRDPTQSTDLPPGDKVLAVQIQEK